MSQRRVVTLRRTSGLGGLRDTLQRAGGAVVDAVTSAPAPVEVNTQDGEISISTNAPPAPPSNPLPDAPTSIPIYKPRVRVGAGTISVGVQRTDVNAPGAPPEAVIPTVPKPSFTRPTFPSGPITFPSGPIDLSNRIRDGIDRIRDGGGRATTPTGEDRNQVTVTDGGQTGGGQQGGGGGGGSPTGSGGDTGTRVTTQSTEAGPPWLIIGGAAVLGLAILAKSKKKAR